MDYWLSVDRDKGAYGTGAVRQRDRFVDPWLAVDALDDTPGHLILQEVHMLAGSNFQAHAFTYHIEARVKQGKVALGAVGRHLFGDVHRPAKEEARYAFLSAAHGVDPDHAAGRIA